MCAAGVAKVEAVARGGFSCVTPPRGRRLDVQTMHNDGVVTTSFISAISRKFGRQVSSRFAGCKFVFVPKRFVGHFEYC